MDEETHKSYLTTVKEMILDEKKIVTYVYLSKILCIHVNESKVLLSKVVNDIRASQGNVELNICYIISGLCDTNKARTTVSTETEIEEIRKKFSIVFYEHIYSVSLGPPFIDNAAFLATHKFEDFPLCTGLIKSAACTKRTIDEIDSLKSSSQKTLVQSERPTVQNKVKSENKVLIKQENDEPKNITKTKSEPIVKTEVTSPKKDTNAKQKIDNKKNNNRSQTGIAGFFNKSNSAPTKKAVKDSIASKDVIKMENVVPKQGKTDIDNKKSQVNKKKMDVEEEMDVDQEIVEVESVKTVIKKETPVNGVKNKSISQIKKNAKVDKKRKRVLHVSDSESEGEKDPFADEITVDDHESDDDIPPTPMVNTVKITSGIVNPKKRRKVVDKTYTDEDGYILTKKEVVYESCSDNEDQVQHKENVVVENKTTHVVENKAKQETSPTKKNAVKNNKKKISPPQKGKQATLMSFFKKV